MYVLMYLLKSSSDIPRQVVSWWNKEKETELEKGKIEMY